MKRIAVVLLTLIVTVAAHAAGNAPVWIVGDGDYNTAANWSTGVAPVDGDGTSFTNNTAYTVSFAANSPIIASNYFNGKGTATLNITGFTWTLTNFLTIARSGNSTATVYLAGGTIAVTNVVGTATNGVIRVGDSGSSSGAFFVTNGLVMAVGAEIGANAGNTGKLVISDGGAWTNFGTVGTITVGSGSAGNSLVVSNTGKLSFTTLLVGSGSGGKSNAYNIGGPGASTTTTNTGAITLGNTNGGGDNSLNITNGTLVSLGAITVGGANLSSNNIIRVLSGGALNVGNQTFSGNGFGASLLIDGGVVTNIAGSFWWSNGSGSDRITVTNAGQILFTTPGTDIEISRNSGADNRVTVTGNNSIFNAGGRTIRVGGGVGTQTPTDNILRIADNGMLTNAGSIFVSDFGPGTNNQLIVENAGSIQCGEIRVGTGAGSFSNLVQVGGSGSPSIVNAANITVGQNGKDSYNRLVITNGTLNSTGEINIGNNATASNDTASVLAGGLWNSATNVIFRLRGFSGTLTVDGGTVTNIGKDLWIGNGASGNTVVLTNGGKFFVVNSSTDIELSRDSGLTNNSLLVTGANSLFDAGGRTIRVGGASGSGGAHFNRLQVSDSGIVSNVGSLYIADFGPGTGNVVRVAGGTLSVTTEIRLPTSAGLSNQLVVGNSGTIVCPNINIGTAAGATANSMVVSSGTASVVGNINVGSTAGAFGNSMLVSDVNFSVNGQINVGAAGVTNHSVTVAAGGVLNLLSNRLNADGVGGTWTIDGGTVTNAGDIIWGNSGSSRSNVLQVINGGKLYTGLGGSGLFWELSRNSGAASNVVIVSGSNSKWDAGNKTVSIGGTVGGATTASTIRITASGVFTNGGISVGSAGVNHALIIDNSGLAVLNGLNIQGGHSASVTGNGQLFLGASPTGSGSITLASGGLLGANVNLTIANPVTLASDVATFQCAGQDSVAHNITINVPLSGGGGFNKTGNGILTLTQTNTYTGPTTISAGKIVLASATNVTGVAVLSNITVNAGATFAINVGGAGQWTNSDLDALMANAVFGSCSMLAIDTSGGNFQSGTPLNGSFGLLKLGGNTLTFTNANTYSCGTVISNGTLALGNDFAGDENQNSLGSGDVTIANGGQLRFGGKSGSLTNYTIANNINLSAGSSIYGNDGAQHLTGAVAVNGNATFYGLWKTKALYFEGIVSGPGNLTLHDNQFSAGESADFHFVNGSNTYSGTITVNSANNGSRLFIDADTALTNSTIILNGIADANSNALLFATSAPIIGGIASNGNFAIPAGVTLSVGNNNASTLYSGIISSNGALTKVGTGTLTLSGTNTYSGNTTVSAGTLALAGDSSVASSQITVNGTLDVAGHTGGGYTIGTGQTLAGSGSVTGAVTLANGATLSPGNSPGTLTINGDLIMNASTILSNDLGSSSDQVVVNGSLTLTGTVNVADSGGFGIGNYTLMTYTGALSGGGLAIGTVPNNSLAYGIVAGGGTVVLQVTAGGPAPGSYEAWADHYGLTNGCASCGANGDYDGDGMSNTNEFLAGFNPTNGTAYAHITSAAKSANDIVITYLGSNGDTNYPGGPSIRTNVLEATTGIGSYTNNFTVTVHTDILSNGIGGGASVTVTDDGGATNNPARYYRVRIIAP